MNACDRRALDARLAAADPARALAIDAGVRLELWRRLAAQAPAGAPARRPGGIRARLRRRLVLLPALAVLGGAALGADPAWCAPCHGGGAVPHASARPAAAAISVAAPATSPVTDSARPR